MEITNELRDRADELNARQMEILDRFPVLMALDDADRKPIVDELMQVEDLRDALNSSTMWLLNLVANQSDCGDPDCECPLQDARKDWHIWGQALKNRALLDQPD